MASLSCSLFTALGAVLGRQWLQYYDQENQLRPLSEQGRDRHRKYLGAEKWHFKAVIETLPTLLQFSLFLFFAAQIDLFWSINTTVAIVILVFASLSFSFYVTTTLIAVFAFGSPFQTRLSALLHRLMLHITRQHDIEDEDDVIGAQCVNWLLRTTTLPKALAAAVRAVEKLSREACDTLEFDVTKIVTLLLKPVALAEEKIQFGISTESLRSSLPGLVGLIHQTDSFRWQDILPHAELYDIKHSLCEALLKVSRSQDPDVKFGRWILAFFGTIDSNDSDVIKELDTLYEPLLHNLPSFSTSTQPYTDLATICLLVKDAAPAALIASALGVQFDTLKKHLFSLSLDVFFTVPSNPSASLILRHHSPMGLVVGKVSAVDISEEVKASHPRIVKAHLECMTSFWNYQTQHQYFLPSQGLPTISTLQEFCLQWSNYLEPNQPDRSIFPLLIVFLENHLFHWLEVLVQRNRLDVAVPSLRRAQEWLTVSAITRHS